MKCWIFEDNDTVFFIGLIITISIFQYFFQGFIRRNVYEVHEVKAGSCRNSNWRDKKDELLLGF